MRDKIFVNKNTYWAIKKINYDLQYKTGSKFKVFFLNHSSLVHVYGVIIIKKIIVYFYNLY